MSSSKTMDIIKQLENNHDDLVKNWQNAVSLFASDSMDACEHDVEEEREMNNEWTTDEDSNEEENRYDNIIPYLLLQMLEQQASAESSELESASTSIDEDGLCLGYTYTICGDNLDKEIHPRHM